MNTTTYSIRLTEPEVQELKDVKKLLDKDAFLPSFSLHSILRQAVGLGLRQMQKRRGRTPTVGHEKSTAEQ